MKVLVDTSIWSLALRRPQKARFPEAEELRRLVVDRRVEIIGPIRQEILSGVQDPERFEQVASYLRAFPDVPIGTEDYVTAAKFFNLCRSKGIQGSNTDFLICCVAVKNDLAIFASDKDFALFSNCLPIRLHKSALIA